MAQVDGIRLRSSPAIFFRIIFFWCIAVSQCQSSFDAQYAADSDSGRMGSYPVHKLVSSELKAPRVNILHRTGACDDGLLYLISPRGWKVPRPGPMILDGNGSLVWTQHFANQFGGDAYDLKVQKYKGEDHLTFWLGDDRVRGHGAGSYYVLNSSYDVVHEVRAANGRHADLHEFLVTPEGTALLIVYQVVKADVRPLGRKFNDLWNQAIWDCFVQEVNLETGELLFEWQASEHLNMTLTYNKIESANTGTAEQPFDWIHINSVAKDTHGNYLLSARNTHSIIYIDGRTKGVLWTLGGKGNDFLDLSNGRALNFAWQHDARFVSQELFPHTYTSQPNKRGTAARLMTIFDNAALDWNYEYGPPYSRALLLEVTYPASGKQQSRDSVASDRHATDSLRAFETHALSETDLEKVQMINGTDVAYTVRAIREYINPDHVRSSTQGSVQLLPQPQGEDARVLVGYGINAVITEFFGNGSLACDMHFAARTSWEKGDAQSYRAYKFPWVGRPRQPPSAAVTRDHIYISWNGATEVHTWVLQSRSRNPQNEAWAEVRRAPKTGSETSIPLLTDVYDVRSHQLRVLALDNNDQECENGVSDPVFQDTFLGSMRSSLKFGARMRYEQMLAWSTVLIGVCFILYRFRRRRMRLRVARNSTAGILGIPSVVGDIAILDIGTNRASKGK